MENIQLLSRQVELLKKMLNGEKIFLFMPRRSGRNRFKNFIKEKYPKLYNEYLYINK